MRGRFSYIRAGSKKRRCYRHVPAFCPCHDRPPSGHARVARTCGTRPFSVREQGPAARRSRPQPGDDDRREQLSVARLARRAVVHAFAPRSDEHTSELQSLMRISYAVFCLKKKKTTNTNIT